MAGRPRTAPAREDRLTRLMRELRGDRPQAAAAELANRLMPSGERPLTQPKIAKAEAGRFPLTPGQADAYARGLAATAAQRRELVRLARDYAETQIRSRAVLQRNAAEIQLRTRRLEQESALVRSWQDTIVLGVLQTPAYRAAVLGGRDPGPAWLEERAKRHQLLRDGGREWRLLMYEGALRWALGSHTVMAEQMRHLIDASTWPGVTLGVVAQDGVKPYPSPAAAFHLYGSRMVVFGVEAGTWFLSDPRDVAAYEEQFDAVERVALTGDDARTLLDRIAAVHTAQAD